MKYFITAISATAFGFIGFASIRVFDLMYGIIICFNNIVVRVSAPIIGLILGAAAGIVAAVVAYYKDRLLVAEQKNNGQKTFGFERNGFADIPLPVYHTAYEMHRDEQHLFPDNENTRVCNQQHSL